MKRKTFAILMILIFLVFPVIPLIAQEGAVPETSAITDAASGFDFNLLWKGALAGVVLSAIRFFSKKGFRLKEFDWKYAISYVIVGVVGGGYCAWQGIDLVLWYDYAAGVGAIAIVSHLLKGGKLTTADILNLLKIFTKKKPEGDPGSGSEEKTDG